jgi:hypothetical protein
LLIPVINFRTYSTLHLYSYENFVPFHLTIFFLLMIIDKPTFINCLLLSTRIHMGT